MEELCESQATFQNIKLFLEDKTLTKKKSTSYTKPNKQTKIPKTKQKKSIGSIKLFTLQWMLWTGK